MKQVLKFQKFIVSVSLLFLLTFSACEVGLGEAVDTSSPNVSITYPPASSTIRDSFIIAGICEDDKGVSSVKVSITNTDEGKSYGTYDASVSGNTWQVQLNEKGSGKYNGYLMPDGRYVAEVIATDGSGRQSGISSLSFDIDNTAPVVIFSEPGIDSLADATAYGTKFKISATIAEDHNVSKMVMNIFDAETEKLITTIERTNIEIAGGTEVAFAEKGGDGDLDLNYRTLYNYETESQPYKDKKYYCEIEISDSARQYKKSESDSAVLGNKTSKFYFYDDVYNAWLSSDAGLETSSIKKIFNGTYSGNFSGAQISTPTLKEDESIDRTEGGKLVHDSGKEAFDYVKEKLFRQRASFILNPDANPSYTVVGFAPPSNNEFDDSNLTQAISGQSVSVQVIAGRNKTNIDPATLKVYQFGPYETLFELKADLDKIYNNPTQEALDEKRNEIADNSSYSSSSTDSYVFSVHLGALKGNKYYAIAATGKDKSDCDIKNADNKYFVCKGQLSGNAPVITIGEPDSDNPLLNPKDLSILGSNKLSFTGTVSSDSDITSARYSVCATDEKQNSGILKNYSGNLTFGDGGWNFDLANDANFIELASGQEFLYEVTVLFSNDGGTSSVTRKIHVDTTKPVVELNSITPYIESTDTVDGDKKLCLNGTFTVTGSVTETNLETVWYEIWSDGAEKYSYKSEDLGAKYTISGDTIKIDSTDANFKIEDETEIEIKVYARDKAGNESFTTSTVYNGGKNFKVSQKTDRPVITGNNFCLVTDSKNLSLTLDLENSKGNIFDEKSNHNLIGTITDDDGFESITVFVYSDKDKHDETTRVSNDAITFTKGTTVVPFTYKGLPTESGIYWVIIEAVDSTYSAATSEKVNANRKTTYGPFCIAIDNSNPVVTETLVKTEDTQYVNEKAATVDFGGTIADDWEISKLNVFVEYTKADSSDETSAEKIEELKTSYTLFPDSKWTHILNLAGTDYKDGLYKVTFTATDAAGKTSSVVRTVYKDTQIPEFGNSTITDKNDSGYKAENVKPYITTPSVNGWYNTNSLTVIGGISDSASGVKKVEYTLDNTSENPSWTELSGTSSFGGTIAGVQHYGTITLRATDNAGNEAFYRELKGIKIDTSVPSAVITKIDGSAEGVGNKLSNGKTDILLEGEAEDSLSGIASIKISINGKNFTDSDSTVDVENFNDNDKDATVKSWSAVIPNGKLKNAKSGTVWAQVTDNAGNVSEVNLFSLQVDTSKPSVAFNGDIQNATVNKKITVAGTANDDQKLASVKLEYKFGSNDTDWKEVASDGTDSGNKVSGTYNWSITELDTEKAFGETIYDCDSEKDGIQVVLRVTATDEAGNDSVSAKTTITVDQNADRPVITFTNLNPLNGMSESNYLFFNNTKMLGNITDDDGVAGLVFKVIVKELSANEEPVAPAVSEWEAASEVQLSSGSWNYTLSSQGKQAIYFYVKDSKGAEFYSKITDTADEKNFYDSVYLKDETNVFGNSDKPSSILYLRVDTVPPEYKDPGYNFYSVKDGKYLKADSDTWDDSVSKQIFGGNTSKFKIRITASDANGIKNVTGTMGEKTSDQGYKVYQFTYKGTDAEKNGLWVSGDILTGGLSGDGNLKDGINYFTISVTDNADTSRSITLILNVDNTKPEVTISNPSSITTVSGEVSAYGGVNEDTELYYAISVSNEVSPDDEATAITSWKDVNGNSYAINDIKDKIKYTAIKGASLQWYIYFDGDTDESLIVSHDKTLNDYLIDYGITTEAAIKATDNTQFDKIVNLYLWVKAIDKAGNVTEEKHLLKLDPQGDRPTVSLSYPEKDGDTLGGTIKIYGEANDNKSVETVWLQVISQKDSSDWSSRVEYDDTTTPYIIKKFEVAKSDLDLLAEKGYKVFNYKTYKPDGTQTVWTPGKTLATGESYSDYAILANSSGNTWNLKINVYDELNPVTENSNVIAIRAIAKDGDNKESIPFDRIFTIDSDKPVFGSSQQFYLVQSDSKDYTASSTASRIYTEDMFVKGEWYLIGSVEDDVGIKNLKVKNNLTSENLDFVKDESLQSGTDFDVYRKDDNKKVIYFKYKLKTESGVGNLDLTFTAEDIAQGTTHTQEKNVKINFDNTAPVLVSVSDSGYNISPSVKQTNNFYTFGSRVKEDAVSGVNQSGFDYVSFYFVRRSDRTTDGKNILYDIMLPRTDAGNKIELSSLTYQEGLYWKQKNVIRDESTPGLLKLDEPDSNIHAGGLVKIGGTNYMIQSVSGTDVNISEEVPVEYTEALFACSLVVNNTVTETEFGALQSDGYYLKPANDDGDRMIESVTKSGTTWSWEADICSKNIPDGAIELHYVAFDKAGNYSIGVMGCTDKTTYDSYGTDDTKSAVSVYDYNSLNPAFVSNNQPRIAGVIFGTDDNGDGNVGDKEIIKTYGGWYNTSNPYNNLIDGVKVNGQKANGDYITEFNIPEDLSDSVLAIKGRTVIKPEIVGGNNGLQYTYEVTKYDEDSAYYSSQKEVLTDEDSSTNAVRDGIAIDLTVKKLLTVSGSKSIEDGKKQKFTFKIWDNTEGTVAGSTSQYATINLIADVVLKDNEKAKAWLKPFFWKWNDTTKSIESSIYNNDRNNGHIEIESDWKNTAGKTGGYNESATSGISDGDPKVSGIISLRGTASDNVCVNEIWLKIPGLTTDGGFMQVAKRDAGNWVSVVDLDDDGLLFELDGSEEFSQITGNTVNFMIHWNTAKIAEVAAYDKTVEVMARDRGSVSLGADDELVYTTNGNSDSSTVQTAEENLTPYYKVDVVPYITGVETALKNRLKSSIKAAYSRTALGRYIVSADESEIALTGFNLGTQNKVAPASLASGYYSITVNGVESINNKNYNDACGSYKVGITESSSYSEKNIYAYNRQPVEKSNHLLTDDVYFDVWEFDSDAAIPMSGKLSEPVMKINPNNGKIGFAFVSGPADFSMADGNNDSYKRYQRNYATFSNVSLAFDDAGNSYGTATGLDTYPEDATKTLAGRFTFMTSRWGIGDLSMDDNYNAQNKIRFEAIGLPGNNMCYVKGTYPSTYTMTETRFASPSLAVASHESNTSVYLAYYDDVQGQIRFRYGSVCPGSKADFNNFVDNSGFGDLNNGYKRVFESYTENFSLIAGADWQKYKTSSDTTNGYTKQVGSNWFYDTGYNAGQYVAIDVIAGSSASNDKVVAVWYDGTDCWLGLNTNPTIGNDNGKEQGWSCKKIFSDGGEYCTVKTGPDGSIHIAANVDGSLKYAYIKDTSSIDSYNEARDSVTVDSFTITGEQINIDVGRKLNAQGAYVVVPVISYYVSAAKLPAVASLVIPDDGTMDYTAQGTVNDVFTGNWEVSLIPTASTMSGGANDKVNVGLWKKTVDEVKGVIVNSSVMNSTTKSSNTSSTTGGSCYGNGTANPVLGYAIKTSSGTAIETAQKK